MIKIFESLDFNSLENKVNNYIDKCDSKISDIQFRTVMNEEQIIFHVCIVHDLDFANSYK